MHDRRPKSLSASPKSKDITDKPDGQSDSYRPEYADKARAMCKVGAMESDLAEEFGVSLTTIRSWQMTYIEFGEACRIGRERAAERVEQSLYERAIGAERRVVKPMKINGRVELVRYRERLPPDVGAATLLLTNYRPNKWKRNNTGEPIGEDRQYEELRNQIRKEVLEERLDQLMKATEGTALRPRE